MERWDELPGVLPVEEVLETLIGPVEEEIVAVLVPLGFALVVAIASDVERPEDIRAELCGGRRCRSCGIASGLRRL